MDNTLNDLRLVLSDASKSKEEIFNSVQAYLDGLGLTVVSKDFQRPWGGFFVIDEQQARKFSHIFFPTMEIALSQMTGKQSPKILIVQSEKRLSWQYHHRRAEVWKLVAGNSGVAVSSTDDQGPVQPMTIDQVIELKQGQRHRLVGLDRWGMVAEIWQHTDPQNPSDEDDIIRLQDDFGR
jgi:mannose-6-phosphate isomerase-like protein (cupin superfamily)